MVKALPANAGELGDLSFIPRPERSPGGKNGNPLQYSFLENPMDRGVWWATVHRVAKNQTQVSMHAMFFPRPLQLFSIHFLGWCKVPPLILSSGQAHGNKMP